MERKWQISDTLVAFAVPLLGYVVAFIYESGICTMYGIPQELISLELTPILIAVMAVITAILLVGVLIDSFFASFLRKLSRRAAFFFLLAAYQVTMFFLYGLQNLRLWWLECLALGIGLLLGLLSSLGLKPSLPKKNSEEAATEQESDRSLTGNFVRRNLGILCLFLFTIILARDLGQITAIRKTSYYFVGQSKEIIVLRAYPKHLICSSFNSKTTSIGKTILLIPISDQEPLILHLEKTGPLDFRQK